MEVPGGKRNKLVVLLYELLGTCSLIYSVNMSANFQGGGNFQAIAVGLMLTCNIMFLGGISGGHFNPAVTLAVLIKEGRRKLTENLVFACMIWAAEVCGAILGVFCVFMTNRTKFNDETKSIYPGIALLCPGVSSLNQEDGFKCSGAGFYAQIFFVEVLATFIFISVILSVKYHFGSSELILNGVCIGMTLFGMITISGAISGGCLNPAIGLIQPLFQGWITGRYTDTPAYQGITGKAYIYSKDTMAVYIIAPLIGGALSGFWHHYNGYVLENLKDSAEETKQSSKSINEDALMD